MKSLKHTLMVLVATCGMVAQAQPTDVTNKHLTNPDFGARFAAWENAGSFTFNTTATGIFQKSGDVFMEKWVGSGSRLGTNAGMFQDLRNLPNGTYTLTAHAMHISQANTNTTCKGAFLYGSEEKTEVSAQGEYKVVFTVIDGRARVGAKTTGATGNWFCIDNFHLYYNGEVKDSIQSEVNKLVAEADALLAEATADHTELTAATEALRLVETLSGDNLTQAVTRLKRAMLNLRIAQATGTEPKVTTHPFVAMGATMALGRLTATGTGIVERGFCWSTDPNPTLADEHTNLYFSHNGEIYHMEGLEPGTIYYVRAYARTSKYKVGYGEVVKIATLPMGTVGYVYDFKGDDQQNARINSACAETIWMYNQLSNIRGFSINVHYVPGSGAGGGTADCSYGGWMRVSQTQAYQQTGTILHETNHGVGVGTTGEWYNNPNLRAETSRGLWLGPRATQMVRFLDNNPSATLTGDNVHMWPYGINGAHEDSYNPSDKLRYYANILVTHALHQDGLKCSSSVNFATPAYVFTQDDQQKYYIKCESSEQGGNTAYLSMTDNGTLRNIEIDAAALLQNDNCAWYVTYDAKRSYYVLQNVATKRYISYTGTNLRGISKESIGTAECFHFMPSREDVKRGSFSGTSYWVLTAQNHLAMESGRYNTAGAYYTLTTPDYNASNQATAQRWLFLTSEQVETVEQAITSNKVKELTDLIAQVRAMAQTPHQARAEGTEVAEIDQALEAALVAAESADDYASVARIQQHIDEVNEAMLTFLGQVDVKDMGAPFDLTFILTNPSIEQNTIGWSTTLPVNYSCTEAYERSVDFNQVTKFKMPIGTYRLTAQGFQRPGTSANVYQDWQAGTDRTVGTLYLKTQKQLLKNIYTDAQSTSQGTGSISAATQVFIPNTMQAASNYFKKGYYQNEVFATNTIASQLKLGIQSNTSATSTWTIFDNFKLYYYGNYTPDTITPVIAVEATTKGQADIYYDLQGRKLSSPRAKGIYILNGRKIVK